MTTYFIIALEVYLDRKIAIHVFFHLRIMNYVEFPIDWDGWSWQPKGYWGRNVVWSAEGVLFIIVCCFFLFKKYFY